MWVTPAKRCGSRSAAFSSSREGFTLIEVSLALVLSTIVLALSTSLMVSLWRAENRLTSAGEVEAMWASAHRVLATDAHAATSATLRFESLMLTEADGITYRYLANNRGQLVRIETGGGTAVIATMVQSVAFQVLLGEVHASITFTDGETREMTLCTLSGAVSSSLG
ncbi:PulJ/GspJ family protein [Alicyclobacillus sp. ALC3]|uniref:PulJ/GspJ family protein n=1 Tax=Alicyclobacillus sp. ALC3 TaxID=2796143 RepID=UPI002379F7BA|nr:prepilin-type N-terminal cleavage/methylation domain-containing protein [Alicyclobacillus sp. ALC3]